MNTNAKEFTPGNRKFFQLMMSVMIEVDYAEDKGGYRLAHSKI